MTSVDGLGMSGDHGGSAMRHLVSDYRLYVRGWPGAWDTTQAELAQCAQQYAANPEPKAVQPGDWLASLTSAERKEAAVLRGFLAYFPDAVALVARHSVRSNEKHNPGQPVHWSRSKSSDHGDCEIRHAIAVAVNADAQDDGQYEMVCKAWRAMADLQLWAEEKFARDGKID